MIGLKYQRPEHDEYELNVYCDASHANLTMTGRSVSGTMITLNGNLLDWTAKHQGQVALHSGEAETIAASTVGTCQLLYWRQLITEQLTGIKLRATLFLDSSTAIANLTQPVHTSHMKHLRVKLLFVREYSNTDAMDIRHFGTDMNPADSMTKPTSGEKREKLYQTLRFRTDYLVSRGGASQYALAENARRNETPAKEQTEPENKRLRSNEEFKPVSRPEQN